MCRPSDARCVRPKSSETSETVTADRLTFSITTSAASRHHPPSRLTRSWSLPPFVGATDAVFIPEGRVHAHANPATFEQVSDDLPSAYCQRNQQGEKRDRCAVHARQLARHVSSRAKASAVRHPSKLSAIPGCREQQTLRSSKRRTAFFPCPPSRKNAATMAARSYSFAVTSNDPRSGLSGGRWLMGPERRRPQGHD